MIDKSAKENKQFPNFIIIMADQMRADFIESENPVIKTPNLKRIEEGGTKFIKAYPPTPVCLPCRCSMLTGKYPSSIGSTHNDTFLPLDYSPTIGHIFQDFGYYTHIIGKSHFSSCHDTMSPESPPHIHNRDFYKNWKGPWYGFQYADITIGHSTEPHACGMHYGAWLEERGVDTSQYFGNTSYTQYGAWDLPEEFHSNYWIYETTKNALQQAENENKPFLLWVNFQDPHNPCMVPEPWASMYDPKDMPPLGFKKKKTAENLSDISEPDNFSTKPPFYQELISQKGAYMGKCSDPDLPGFGNVSHLDWDDEKVRENAAAYCGMISFMDKYIGKILDEIERRQLLDNTFVIFTSDHGDLLGDHGLFWKGVVSFEEMMRVPLIISGPGIPQGKISTALQGLVDIPVTLLNIINGMNGSSPVRFEGINQYEVWSGINQKIRDYVIVEERPYSTDFALRVIINENYKLVFYANRRFGELYDIKRDPDQLINLWNDKSYAEIKNNLIIQLLSHEMLKTPVSPTPTEYFSEQIPNWRKDFEDFVMILGQLLFSDELGWFVKVRLTTNAVSVQDIPISELLEELEGKVIYIADRDDKSNGTDKPAGRAGKAVGRADKAESRADKAVGLIGGTLKISDNGKFGLKPVKDLNKYASLPINSVKQTSISDGEFFNTNYNSYFEKYLEKEVLIGIIRAANPAVKDLGYELFIKDPFSLQ